MTYVLVIILFFNNPYYQAAGATSSIEHIEFSSLKLCNAAKDRLPKATKFGWRSKDGAGFIHAYCTAK